MKPLSFSQRIGKIPVRQALQIDDIDEALSNRLWNNIIEDLIFQLNNVSNYNEDADKIAFCRITWIHFFEYRIDEIPTRHNTIDASEVIDIIKKWYLKAEWFRKYDLIQFLIGVDKIAKTGFTEKVKKTLKNGLSGYTILNREIVPITSEQEVSAIEGALNNTSKHQSVETHLKRALELLSDRQSPDYRNSIKESISAVEAYCIILTGNSTKKFSEALAIIEKKHKLHGSLKSAFGSLYGYSSDAGGIRHALLEDNVPVTFEDAKFMLVSCSAFINYLKAKET